MSVTLAQAYKRATEAIADGQRITFAREGNAHWFFGVGDAMVNAVPGGSPIAVDKRTGDTSYPMPAVPSIVMGELPTPIEEEMANATSVPLPV